MRAHRGMMSIIIRCGERWIAIPEQAELPTAGLLGIGQRCGPGGEVSRPDLLDFARLRMRVAEQYVHPCGRATMFVTKVDQRTVGPEAPAAVGFEKVCESRRVLDPTHLSRVVILKVVTA